MRATQSVTTPVFRTVPKPVEWYDGPVDLGRHMQAEIMAQPQILRDNAERYFEEAAEFIGGRAFDMVLMTARGSSDNAALYARYLFEVGLGVPVSLAAPSVLTKYGVSVKYKNCLAIGVSQSGAAPDVSEILASLRAQGHTTLAITNTEGSRVTKAAEHTLLLRAGQELSVAATKTYTSSLLALYQCARALEAPLPNPIGLLPEAAWVSECRGAAEQSVGALLRSSRWFALARGFSFCSAQETALKLMECALIPCKSYSAADFQHGPIALASHGAVVVSYGEPPDGLGTTGCLLEQAPVVQAPPEIAPLHEILYGQWLALLAARARGIDPDAPLNLHKVTETR
ncbi:MAG: SIS domain-containing protein [Armatimonadetes bacterium]|nr:SIS domain-containing protein [Armatimonadota bacterium]